MHMVTVCRGLIQGKCVHCKMWFLCFKPNTAKRRDFLLNLPYYCSLSLLLYVLLLDVLEEIRLLHTLKITKIMVPPCGHFKIYPLLLLLSLYPSYRWVTSSMYRLCSWKTSVTASDKVFASAQDFTLVLSECQHCGSFRVNAIN